MSRPASGRRRVLVVDDSAFVRSLLASMIRSHPDLEVAGLAADGEEAIRLALRHRPDMVVLDLDLPRVGGLGFLRWLMRHQPVPVLVVTGARNGREVLRALDLGAVDFVLKPTAYPSERMSGIREELVRKLVTLPDLTENLPGIAKSRPRPSPGSRVKRAQEVPPSVRLGAPPVVAVGASTGGPPAVQYLLASLPADWPGSIVVAQHMPALFTSIFAERLNRIVPMHVSEARDGEVLRPGRCLILPGGQQGLLERSGNQLLVRLRERLEEERYSPSVDLLFRSAAEAAGSRLTAVVLTGMGEDGAGGVLEVRRSGGRTLAEARQSAVVYGMPQAAIGAGGVDEVLPLEEIARRLQVLGELPPRAGERSGDRHGPV